MPLIDRATKLRVRRRLRAHQKRLDSIAKTTTKHVDKNFIGRFGNLAAVWRFSGGWLLLVMLLVVCTIVQTASLSNYYQTARPVAGGLYNEGMVGTYSNANPLFATGSVDSAVSRLIFAGLLKYDDQNHLVGDLASGYTVSANGKHYEVTLKPNLTWQDGAALTADDVVFTYHLIQNPDAGSPMLRSWQGISVTAKNLLTIDFDLPNAFAAFPYSLVSGIAPKHILDKIPADQVRSSAFSTTQPVGAGPFAWQSLQTSNADDPAKSLTLIALSPFAGYNGGQPKLNSFVLHVFGDETAMLRAFSHRDLTAMAGLDSVPAKLNRSHDINIVNFQSTAANMVFFKTSSPALSDTKVRQALVQGVDTTAILHGLDYVTEAVREPLLMGQIGYDAKYQQASYDPAAANTMLDEAGWVKGATGLRMKDGKPLTFNLYAQDTPENHYVTKALVKYWKTIGVKATPVFQTGSDLQTTIAFHGYDALLNGISIGADPDVFAYWDSSQADARSGSQLNFSEYKSDAADASLEAGRTRLDPALRAVKYQSFLEAWQKDAPALGLYQPRFLYITRSRVYGLSEHTLNVDADRYNSVANWEIRTARVTTN